jgi:hypothetical protein
MGHTLSITSYSWTGTHRTVRILKPEDARIAHLCFVRSGYLVLSPDYFHGEQLDHFRSNDGFSLPDWIGKFKAPVKDERGNEVDRTTLLLKEWTKVVKGMFGGEGTKYAVVGE